MNIIKLSMSKWHIKTTMPFISLGRAGENNSCQILFDVDKVMESNATTIVAYFLDIYDNDNATSRRSQLLDTDISSLRLFTMLGRQFLGKQGIKTLQVRCIVTDRKGNELRTYLSNKLNVQVEAGYSSTSHFDSSIILAQLSDRIQYLTDDVDDLRTHGIPQDVLKDTIIRYFSDNPIDTLTEDEVNEIISIYVTNHKADMPKGDKGDKGENGADGKDAYTLAVEKGFKGTEEQWLESLHGKDGKNGVNGTTPIKGTDYWTTDEVSQVIEDIVNKIQTYILNNKADFKGQDGIIGKDGKSAYDIALENGFSGDETAWLNSLKGDNGLSSYEIAVKNGFKGSETEFITSLQGKKGDNGSNGQSAYQIAVKNGFKGTEQEWLTSLKGQDGKDGKDGLNGKSAYELAVLKGFQGTEQAWLDSLKGEDGTSYDDTEIRTEINDIWKAQGELGAKNLLVYPYFGTPNNYEGIEFIDSNGAITINGIPSTNAYYNLRPQEPIYLKNGKYIISTSTSLGNGIYLQVIYNDGSGEKSLASITRDITSQEFIITDDIISTATYWVVRIAVLANTQVDNLTVYPMIRLATDLDDTWQPYTFTNRELNERVNNVANDINNVVNDIYKAQGILGAKNLIPYPYINRVCIRNGITWTCNDDGSVTVNGQIESGKTYSFADLIKNKGNLILTEGAYRLTVASNAERSNAHIEVRIVNWNDKAYVNLAHIEVGQKGQIFNISAEMVEAIKDTTSQTYLQIIAQTADINEVFDNLTLYPMLCLASDTDNTWQPYAMTNKELTDKQNELAVIAGEYLVAYNGGTSKKRIVSVGATECFFYYGDFADKFGITSTSDLNFDISAETASGNVVAYNQIVLNTTTRNIYIRFDELTEQATFICKCSKIQ